jgi:putative flavoprotein involved in K+ transport
VTMAVGRHTRMPRTYRGMDTYWWLDRLGLLDTTIDEMPDRLRAAPAIRPAGRQARSPAARPGHPAGRRGPPGRPGARDRRSPGAARP